MGAKQENAILNLLNEVTRKQQSIKDNINNFEIISVEELNNKQIEKQNEILKFLKLVSEKQSEKEKANSLFAILNIIVGIINVCLFVWQIIKG